MLSNLRIFPKALRVLLLGTSLLMTGTPRAALTDISDAPLAQPAQNVKPNVMFILDDSYSMVRQYTPDYVTDRNCLTSGSGFQDCVTGDPPAMSPDFNYQYYNPEIRYFVPLDHDGTSRSNMTSANTSAWASVPTDGVSTGTTVFQVKTAIGTATTTAATADLVTNYPDRVWCTSSTDSVTDPTKCKRNSGYLYPDGTQSAGQTANGAPYYYRIAATEYCTDETLTICVAALAPTSNYTVPARVRFCDSSGNNCQAKRMGTSLYPNFKRAAGTPTGTIEITAPGQTAAGSITAIYVDGVNIISGTVAAADGTDTSTERNTVATAIATAINSHLSTPDYTATVSGNIVTITPAVPDSSYHGKTIVVASTTSGTTAASGKIRFQNVGGGDDVNSITIAGVGLIPAQITCSSGAGCTNSYGRNKWMAERVVAAINANTTSGLAHGYTTAVDPSDNTRIIVTAPSGTGAEMNGQDFSVSDNGISVSTNALSGGASLGLVITSTEPFTAGAFSRVDIVPFQDAANTIASQFAKYPSRTDCAGTFCTYPEEMTNFANWYAYYRSRMQMTKTAVGRAFNNLSDRFRVGFITINPNSPVSSSRYLKVDDFTSGAAGQKDLFYQRLYSTDTDTNRFTPLREALSRVGRYYADVTSGINDGMDASPIQVSCQPSYAILATDGYWNGNSGDTLTGGVIGDEDNVNSGYSTQAVGAWDGATGASGTLADVAMYYYKTDLRTTLDDHVPTTNKDTAPHQHMTTFTIGLGLAGELLYDPNYETQTKGDFFNIKQDTRKWPNPTDSAYPERRLDDLWHAAVNGRGKFFSARDPNQLTSSLVETIESVNSRVGAGAAAATSNLRPVPGDNFAFTAQYQTVVWSGDVQAKTVDLDSGVVATRQLWSAQEQLDKRPFGSRKIYTYDPTDTDPLTGNTNKLKFFCWAGANAVPSNTGCVGEPELSAAEMSVFDPLTLAHAGTWATDGSGRDLSATQQNFIDFLRGDVANESSGGTGPTDLYRNRANVLGDIVNAQPAYQKVPPFFYNTGEDINKSPFYQEFKADIIANRRGTVYIAANDGMLHAFETDPDGNPYFQTAGIATAETTDDAFTGTLSTDAISGEGAERWAYIPRMVLSGMKRLAEIPYTHTYFVDGSPIVVDFCVDNTKTSLCAAKAKWRTMLVAGLNAGGRGYYALDVTDPMNPKALWEFTSSSTCLSDTDISSGAHYADCHVGYSFGNPQVTKRLSDDRWVVLVTSGYNNVSPGDGKGYLYVLDAATGQILKRIGTGEGCDGSSSTAPCTAGTPDPSGLGKINNWLDNGLYTNVTQYVYGGDLWGNVWRFDIDAGTAFKLAVLKDPSGVPQPITTKPELGEVSNFKVVYVATGRMLGASDLANTQRQTIYAIKDPITVTQATIVSPRATPGFVSQTLTDDSPTTRTGTANAMDFATQTGWYADLPDGGDATSPASPSERANVDPELQLGSLIVPTNVPSSDTCVAGGYGWVNTLDARTGAFVAGSNGIVGQKVSSSVIVGINVIQLPSGTVKAIVTTADNQQTTVPPPFAPSTIVGRRVSWRELIVE